MTIRHHLSDQLLMAYSAGQLPEAFNLVVATHISLCDECRARLASFDAVGGAVLEECEAAPMSEDSLMATLARLRDAPPEPRRERNSAGTAQAQVRKVFPTPLQDYVGGGLDAVKWRPLGGGVRQAILPTSREARVRLLHIPAGLAVPDHGHRGIELTQVLQGAFRDEHDRFGPGDIEIATEADVHTPVAEPGVDCICLAATDAPLRFSALLPRLAQPFFRI
ncbi:ChrR family anti-sigma-E factor [Alkalilacustris brevis]|uniref:ChrR family anti-sigma-E factor n=1 Tax=Alkalilacustris brevis TaxID=2026338 RepID=UPI000E0CF1A9|nr:ChrR family anti-sigma-E factor [Alkalilacustris brevis]